jgi:hypothetical protein
MKLYVIAVYASLLRTLSMTMGPAQKFTQADGLDRYC